HRFSPVILPAYPLWIPVLNNLLHATLFVSSARRRLYSHLSETIMETVQVEHFYLGCLAHASYLVGSEGVAAVIDPQRDVDIYLEAAVQKGLKIEHIIETHLHADFVSGHRELSERTGARIYLGEE